MTSDHPSQPLATVSFLGFNLVASSAADFARHILDAAGSKSNSVQIAYLNAHTFNLAHEDHAFAAMLRGFTHIYPDGQGVVWASHWLGQPVAERINAADFVGSFLRSCADARLRIALVGGREGEACRFAEVHRAANPDLNIVFAHHGYVVLADAPNLLQSIQNADPHLVLVGMGSPIQEDFVLRASSASSSPRVWWCVGALFEYDSGTRPRAPQWMRRLGLEWFFRLAMEPRRMWRRYILGNPKFVFRILTSRGRRR